jgi:intein-encoded DNA endonuclease-like protein
MAAKRRVNRNFFKTWSRTMAYILGYFAADGTMFVNKRGGHYIEFHSTDKCLIEMTKIALKSNHHVGVKIPPKTRTTWKIAYRVQIGSKEIFADLSKLGFVQNKSNILMFPDVPAKYFPDFVRGYFDGDGCIYFKRLKFRDIKNPKWSVLSLFTSGSRRFLLELQHRLKRYGVKGGSLKNKNRGFELMFSRRDSLALYHLMYDTAVDTGLYLPRKYKLFQKAMKQLYPNTRV